MAMVEDQLSAGPGSRSLGDLDDEGLRKVVEKLIVRSQAAKLARELGLDESPETRDGIQRAHRQWLAAQELGKRVQSELTPLSEDEVRAFFDAHPERMR